MIAPSLLKIQKLIIKLLNLKKLLKKRYQVPFFDGKNYKFRWDIELIQRKQPILRIWATERLKEYIIKILHFVITLKTASEILDSRADSQKENMKYF